MKQIKNKILPVFMSAIILSMSIFSCLNVRAYADVSPSLIDSFNGQCGDIISGVIGYVWQNSVDIGHEFLEFLGLEEENDREQYLYNHYIIDDTGSGSGGHVKIDDTMKNDLTVFCNNKISNNTDFKYCFSWDIDYYANNFSSKKRFQAVKNLLLENQDKKCFIYTSSNALSADPNSSNDIGSIAGGGNSSIQILIIENFSSYVLNTYANSNKVSFSYCYNDDWQRMKYGSSNCKCYGFAERGDLTLSELETVPIIGNSISDTNYNIPNVVVNINNSVASILLSQNFGNWVWVSYNTERCPLYRTVDIMKQNSLGNLPYYQVPTNPYVSYNDGYYSVSTNQLDNSISYGDITSYVDSNNVTSMNVVNNYINNYYANQGSGGSGGSGSGGSGSDIDWGWLGSIGEVIGGLISALGNVISGIISAIGELVTSITEGLPNVFGALIAWALPFLPDYVTNLLSMTILCVVIVSVIRLIRGK